MTLKSIESLSKVEIYVIFFSSPNLVSKVIRKFEKVFLTSAKYSHVGLLFHTSILYDCNKINNKICKPKDKWLVLESTMSGPLNDRVYNTCGKIQFGVQTRELTELLESYTQEKGRIAISRITIDHTSWIEKFNKCLINYLDRGYEIIPTNLLTIHLPFPTIKTRNMFCSELVTQILIELVVNLKYKPKKVSPNKLLKLGILSDPVHLI